jgi:hypothetical protein
MASKVARSRRGVFQSVFQGHDQLWEYQCPVILVKGREEKIEEKVLVSLMICDKLGNMR